MINKKGLTLVEVIVSLAIIGIVAVVFLSVFNMSLTNILVSGNRSQAVNIARSDFYEDPEIMYSSSIVVKLPVPSGEVEYSVDGSYAQSEITIGEGTKTESTVIVRTFLPSLVSD